MPIDLIITIRREETIWMVEAQDDGVGMSLGARSRLHKALLPLLDLVVAPAHPAAGHVPPGGHNPIH